VTDSAIVRGAPATDRVSTEVTTHFDSETLATLPGARDIFAVLANTPGVAMTRMNVGGNGALAMQEYTAHGLRAITGMHRNEDEGIRVGGANGSVDVYNLFNTNAEQAVTTSSGAGWLRPTVITGPRIVRLGGRLDW
jgi:hypothetical protein